MNPQALVCQVVDGLGIITLNDPEDGNRLNLDRITALRSALDRAAEDSDVRIILLRGAAPGKPWCLGMDLDMLAKNLDGDREALRLESINAYNDLLERIAGVEKPVLALVGGPVKAGGVGLAAACDMILCSSDASFELTEVLFGLIPANVMPWLLGRRMGIQKIRYLVMSARLLEPADALAFGLADEAYAPDEAEKGLKKLLKTMLRAEPGALAHSKSFSRELFSARIDEGRSMAQVKLLELMARPETAHALEAFASGSTPSWFGKIKTKEALFFQEYPVE